MTTGPNVRLRAAVADDAHIWRRWRQERSGLAHNPVLDLDVAALGDRLTASGTDLGDRTINEHRWIVETDDGPVGTVAVVNKSWTMGHGEITYQIAESHQRLGIGRLAVALLIETVFFESDLRRLIALIAAGNVASRRLVMSLGFVEEGVLREHFLIGDRPVDEVVYGLLRREWVTRR